MGSKKLSPAQGEATAAWQYARHGLAHQGCDKREREREGGREGGREIQEGRGQTYLR